MHTRVGLEDDNRPGRGAWQPRNGDGPWRREARRGGGGSREPVAPWELAKERRAPGDREPAPGFEGIEALRRSIEAKRKAEQNARREAERKAGNEGGRATPDGAGALPEDLRDVVPTQVRAKPLFGLWWTVQIRIANDSTWWPVSGTATANPDAAEATAVRIRNGALPVMRDRLGNMMLGNALA